jgi:hypothetical protein
LNLCAVQSVKVSYGGSMQQGHVVKASTSQRRSLINDEKTKLSVMLGVAERWALHVD